MGIGYLQANHQKHAPTRCMFLVEPCFAWLHVGDNGHFEFYFKYSKLLVNPLNLDYYKVMMKVSFQTPICCFSAELKESSVTEEMIKSLPFDSKVTKWGDEIYFESDIELKVPELTTTDVSAGDVAFWPEGKCICVFFGPTPLSTDDKPMPASPVIVIGKTTHSIDFLRRIQTGEPMRVMPVEGNPPEPIAKSIHDFSKSRKLSQEEIDDLVQQVLAEKKCNQS